MSDSFAYIINELPNFNLHEIVGIDELRDGSFIAVAADGRRDEVSIDDALPVEYVTEVLENTVAFQAGTTVYVLSESDKDFFLTVDGLGNEEVVHGSILK